MNPADLPDSIADWTPKSRPSDHAWWTHTPVYQVYPRSFMDSDGDGIGDLGGIISRLDHISSLGCGAVWVSPFFASPQRDIGYDVTNYRDVAPEYGSLSDAQALIDGCHERELKVIFDLVLNHTSDQHEWFRQSCCDPNGDKADWYVWHDGRKDALGRRRPPNNWRSELQVTPAWQWSCEREQWFLATFLPFQPDLNWRHPEVRAEMFDMITTWLDRGVDGFRLDIFGSIMHDAQLRDNRRVPSVLSGLPRIQTPNRTLNTDENIELAADLRSLVDTYSPDRALLGELFGPTATVKRYVVDADSSEDPSGETEGLHLVFSFDFLAAPYSAKRYAKIIAELESAFPEPHAPTYVLENHDRTRSASRLGDHEGKVRVMALVLWTLRGVPVMYQGQEIAMKNRYIPLADANDPIPGVVARWLPEAINRRIPERLNRDEVRTPMQWSDAPNAGFSDAKSTWLPVHDNYRSVNVERQELNEDSILALYRSLGQLRAHSPALRYGNLTMGPTSDTVLQYRRSGIDGIDSLHIVANMSDQSDSVVVDVRSTIALATDQGVALDSGVLQLPAHSATVLNIVGDAFASDRLGS